MNLFSIPSDKDFLTEAERFLPICAAHCTCPAGYHFTWSALKASGRRRSVYFQQPLLARLLAPTVPDTRKVLLVGTADSGALAVLASIFGPQVEYVAIDRCAAPLEEVRRYAQMHGLTARCQQVSLQAYEPQELFDLVFVHNTLGFLSTQEIAAVLQQLRKGMYEHSWMACGMRYYEAPEQRPAADIAAGNRRMFRATFANRPDLFDLVEPHIDAHAAEQSAGVRQRHIPADFEGLLAAACFDTVERYLDDQTPVEMLKSLPDGHKVASEVLLLRPAGEPFYRRDAPPVLATK